MQNFSYVEMLDAICSGSLDERKCLARCNQILPDGILQALAEDEDWTVRICLTPRAQTLPTNVLETLAKDSNWLVRTLLSSQIDSNN